VNLAHSVSSSSVASVYSNILISINWSNISFVGIRTVPLLLSPARGLSPLSSSPLGIVVIGVDIVCSGQFAFIESVYREGFSGFSREKRVFEG
jgi:hypothetical protein